MFCLFLIQNYYSHNQELLVKVCDKRKQVKALQFENAKLQVQKDEAEELLALSQKLVENAQDFKVLESENAQLREELENLKKSHETSVSNILESTNHAVTKLERTLAIRDQQIQGFRDELERQSDISSGLQDEIRVLKEERTVLDKHILGPLELGDANSSESRPARIELVGNLTQDLLQILSEAAQAVNITVSDQESALELRNKVKALPKLIEDWKMSYARTAAQNALTMVMSHHSDMEIWQVTKGIATTDDSGNPQDVGAIWASCAGYACRVAEMTNYADPFFESVAVPPSPRSDSEETGEDEGDDGDDASKSPAQESPTPPPAA